MTKDIKTDHLKLMKDRNQHMEDFIVKGIADTHTEMGEGPLAGDSIHRDTCIRSISSAPVLIAKRFQEIAHILESIYIFEQIQQKQTYRIIARGTKHRITICNQGSDKRKIDQRTNHLHITTLYTSIWEDLNKAFLKHIM